MSKFSNRRGYTPSAKFNSIGTEVAGTVVEIDEDAPIPVFEGGRMVGARLDLNGDRMTQVDITVETEDGDQFVLHTNGPMFAAIDKALDEAGLADLVTGHQISVLYTGDGKPAAEGLNAPKEYSVTVKPLTVATKA